MRRLHAGTWDHALAETDSPMIDDAIPELIVTDERSKRKTTEFCTAQCDGYRCMLVKGHDGAHEAVAKRGSLRWATIADD